MVCVPSVDLHHPVMSTIGLGHSRPFFDTSVYMWCTVIGFKGQFFISVKLFFFGFVVAMCDLVQVVEAIFHLCSLPTAAGNLYLKYE